MRGRVLTRVCVQDVGLSCHGQGYNVALFAGVICGQVQPLEQGGHEHGPCIEEHNILVPMPCIPYSTLYVTGAVRFST